MPDGAWFQIESTTVPLGAFVAVDLEVRVSHDRDRALDCRVFHRLAVKVDVFPLDSFAARHFDAEHDVAAAVAAIRAEQRGRACLTGLAVVHRAVLNVEVDAFEVLPRDEVDDSGYGVGAVHGRRAACDDLDALDRGGRDRVQVDGHRRVDGHRPIAVEEHEVAVRAEAAKAHHRRARRGRRARVDELAILDLRVGPSPRARIAASSFNVSSIAIALCSSKEDASIVWIGLLAS